MELIGLITPAIPILPSLPCEQLDIGTGDQALDPPMNAFRFTGVLTARLDDALSDVGIETFRFAARRQQAWCKRRSKNPSLKRPVTAGIQCLKSHLPDT